MSIGVNYAKYELPEYKPMTLVEKLRSIANLRQGDSFPEWMMGNNSWGIPLSELCKEAADKIEALEKFQRLQEMIDNYPR